MFVLVISRLENKPFFPMKNVGEIDSNITNYKLYHFLIGMGLYTFVKLSLF